MSETVDRPAAPETGRKRPQPFVGPRSLGATDEIYGRDREIIELADQIVADRIVVLYSPSGAGKTSLIDAGLRSELLRRDIRALPSIRVGGNVGGSNRYALSTLLSLDHSRLPERRLTPEQLDGIGLGPYLHHLIESGENDADPANQLSPCLVFDQFEELFTLDPADEHAKHEFVAELGAALADRRWWALISMREDFVAQLDPYVRHVSTRLRSRYRLDLLRAEQATAAMRSATFAAGVNFAEDAANHLIDDLRRVRIQRGETVTTEPGPYVEPVQLQVVGRRLWSRFPPAATTIELSHVQALGDVGDALADFYDEQMAEVEAATGVPQRVIRRWIDDELISDTDFRIQADHGPGDERGDEVLARLEADHLIRAEFRHGQRRFELSHDRLVEPVRTSNARWRREHLSLLQTKSEEWIASQRSPVLLIGGEPLDEAVAWAEANPDALSDDDTEYLEACRENEEGARQLRRAVRRSRILAGLFALLFVLAGAAFVFALVQRSNAEDERKAAEAAQVSAEEAAEDAEAARGSAERSAEAEKTARDEADQNLEKALDAEGDAVEARLVAEASELAARSRALQADNPALALALAAESTAVASETGADTLAAIASARAQLRERAWQQILDPVMQREPGALAVRPDGEVFAHAGCPPDADPAEADCPRTTIYVRDIADPTSIRATFTPHNGEVRSLAYSPDGSRLVSAGGTQLWTWDLASTDPEPRPLALDGLPAPDDGGANLVVTSVAFDDAGELLATGDSAGSVVLWPVGDDEPDPIVLDRTDPTDTAVNDVAWRADGEQLASAETDGTVVLWDVGSRQSIRTLKYPVVDEIGPAGVETLRVAFHPDRSTDALVSGHRTGMVWAWQLPNDDDGTAVPLVGHTQDVGGLVFAPGSDLLATTGGDDTIRLWTVGRDGAGAFTAEPFGEPFTEHSAFVRDLAFTPDGSRLVSTSRDGTIRFWGVAAESGVRVLDHGWEACIDGDAERECFATAAAFGPGDEVIVSVGYDGFVRVWDTFEVLDGDGAPTPTAEIDSDPNVDGDAEAGRLYSIAFHPELERAVIGGHGRIWVWDGDADPNAVELVWESTDAEPPPVRAVAFDPMTGRAATSDDCGVVRLWDTDSGVQTAAVGDGACGTRVDALAFGAGTLVAGDGSGEVREYELDGVDGLIDDPRPLTAHSANVRGVDVGGDGETVVSGSEDETVLVLLGDGVLPPLEGHSDSVSAVAANGDYVVSTSNDGTARLWWFPPEPAIGEILPPGERCRSLVECFALDAGFDSAGETLLTAGSDGLVHVWVDLLSPDTACALAEPLITERQLAAELEFEPEVCFAG